MEKYFAQVKNTFDKIDIQPINNVAEAMLKAYENEKIIFICGNGGSSATASHVAGDFIKGVSYNLKKRFKTMCLSDNTPGLMAISNDVGYDDIFVEPLKNFLTPGDLFIGISGSGNSTNVVKAMQYAKENGAATVAFSGYSGGKIKDIADISVHIPIADMEITEDFHMICFHAIKRIIMEKLQIVNASCGEVYDNRVK